VIRITSSGKKKPCGRKTTAGEKIRYYQALDADSEARFGPERSRNICGATRAFAPRALCDQLATRVFEEAMRRAGLSYNIVGGFSFYERMEVRDIIAYLKLAMNQHDSMRLQRVIILRRVASATRRLRRSSSARANLACLTGNHY